MFKLFVKYSVINAVYLAVQTALFLTFYYVLLLTQATSNLLAFALAVTLCFFGNARFTFEQSATPRGYLLFVVFMGFVSWIIGRYGDIRAFHPILTLLLFHSLAWILGFLYARYIVFKSSSV